MKEQRIKLNKPYITLGQFLKSEDFITTGGEAKYFLETNYVLINNKKENRRGCKLYSGDIVTIKNKSFIFYED